MRLMRLVALLALACSALACSRAASTAAPETSTSTSTGASEASSGAASAVDDGIEARFGCIVITRWEIDQEIDQAIREQQTAGQTGQTAEQGTDPDRNAIRQAVLRRKVIETRARDLGLRVPEEDVERALDAVAAQNGISRSELREAIVDQGLDPVAYREDVRHQMLTLRLANLEASRRDLTLANDADRDALFDQIAREMSDREVRAVSGGCVEEYAQGRVGDYLEGEPEVRLETRGEPETRSEPEARSEPEGRGEPEEPAPQ